MEDTYCGDDKPIEVWWYHFRHEEKEKMKEDKKCKE